MNIGLVVNARGKMCMVHDEPFDTAPIWVGYHVDKRRLEIMLESGNTFPIDWESTDEMDAYLHSIDKILIIRMEDKTPVEGYDTSFLTLRGGKTSDRRVLSFQGPPSGDDRYGQLIIRMENVNCPGPPGMVYYAALSGHLVFDWPDLGNIEVADPRPASNRLVMRYSHVRILRAPTDGTVAFDVWLPIELRMSSMLARPAQVDQQTTEEPSGAVPAAVVDKPPALPVFRRRGWVKWFSEERGYGFLGEDSGKDVYVDASSLAESGIEVIATGDVFEYELKVSVGGREAATKLVQISN